MIFGQAVIVLKGESHKVDDAEKKVLKLVSILIDNYVCRFIDNTQKIDILHKI